LLPIVPVLDALYGGPHPAAPMMAGQHRPRPPGTAALGCGTQVEAELEAERQGAEEEQQRAREAIERQKVELQKLEEQNRAKVKFAAGCRGQKGPCPELCLQLR
jgi:hypothetical protein